MKQEGHSLLVPERSIGKRYACRITEDVPPLEQESQTTSAEDAVAANVILIKPRGKRHGVSGERF
jgi:hypothetical protein